MSNNLVFTNLLYFLTKTSILLYHKIYFGTMVIKLISKLRKYAHVDIENKKVSANVIENKLALDTKDTKKEQITELAI